jgi:outer membrane protein assembly complex protein YaeT
MAHAPALRLALLAVALLIAGCGGERARVPIAFEGLHHVDGADLKSAARRELGDFEAHPSEASLADAAWVMEDVLREPAFARGAVDFRIEPSAERPERAVFVVAEGSRAYLERLYFPGAERFPQRQLRGTLEAEGRGPFKLLKAPYRRRDLDSCATSVETLYLLDGFYRVRVGKPVVSFSDDGRGAYAVIPVTEGRRYLVVSAAVDAQLEGSGLTRAQLDPALAAAEIVGKPYYARLPTLAAARIRGWLANRGHLDATVTARVDIDDDRATVAVTFVIVPGPCYLLREVHAIGLDRTKPGFVKNRLGGQPGQPINEDRIDEGVHELSRSGAFSSVRWDKKPLADQGETRPADIDLTVTEARARTLDFELGWGSYEELRGGIRYRDRNLFGQGRYWEVHPTASMKSVGADTHVREDYLVGKNNVADLSGGYLFRIEPTFNRSMYTGTISLEHRFDPQWTTKGGYTYESTRATHVTAPIPGAELSGYVQSPRVFDGLRFDSRDSPVDPTHGALASANLAWSSPYVGSQLNFIEYAVAGAYFLRVSSRAVLGFDGRYTTRQVLDETGTLPIQERLFLGGENSVRSFRQDQLSPRDAQGNAVGGLTAAMATAEARLQVQGRLWTTLFVDVGEVDEQSWHLDGTVGKAVGTGIRYQLPVGPLRFDLAYNPDRRLLDPGAYLGVFAVGFSF